MLKFAAIACLTLAASPAFAGATPWQDLAPGVKARLMSSDRLDGTTTLAGLEIDMPANTKTYWRIPGETGIPTEFDFSASTGIDAPTILWPYPEIDRSDGYLDYVYHGPIVLPVELTTSAASIIDVAVTMGICSDMCVPAMAHFTLPLNFAAPDAAQSIRLDQAVARTPILWDQPGQPFSTVEVGFDGSLHLRNPDPSIEPESVIADLGDPAVLFQTPQKSPDGAVWTLKPLGGVAKKGLEGSSVQLTFLTPSGPYAVTRTIAPSAP
jgi:DsbC/DsbD-like thiol-disulfide interchange protein